MSSAINRIARHAKKFPPLTDEQEKELGERGCQGDEEARETLVNHNMMFAVRKARKWMGESISFGRDIDGDVINDAVIGLCRAALSYDGRKRFAAYAAPQVDWAIWTGAKPYMTATTIPNGTASAIKKVHWAYGVCLEHSLDPSVDDIYEVLDGRVPRSNIVSAVHVLRGHVDFDGGTDDINLHDLIGPSDVSPNGRHESAEPKRDDGLNTILMQFVDMLPDQERRCLIRVYGLDGKEPETMRSLAEKEGVSYQAISQRVQTALSRLRGEDPKYRSIGGTAWKIRAKELKRLIEMEVMS